MVTASVRELETEESRTVKLCLQNPGIAKMLLGLNDLMDNSSKDGPQLHRELNISF